MLVKKIVSLLYIFFVLAIGLAILGRAFIGRGATDSATLAPAKGVGQTDANLVSITWQDKNYQAYYVKVDETSKVDLIANFEEKLTAEQIKVKYNCASLVSGGFYTTDAKPTGFFLSDEKTLRNFANSKLFDGVLSVNDFATPRITRSIPQDHLKFGLQTGPILLENAALIKLSLNSDEPARRVLAAVTGENILYFIVIFNPEQVYDGPYLADLPGILSEIGKQTGISFADAVNLDGGSASAFYAGEKTFSELSSVGSAFCIK